MPSWRGPRAACRARPAHRQSVRSAPHGLRCRSTHRGRPAVSPLRRRSGSGAAQFFSGEGAGKEFRGVPELLGLETHLMPPLGVELAQWRTRFQNLLPAPPQLVGGSAYNRLFSQQAREIVGVARPVAGLDPARSIENKITKARGFDCRPGARKGFLAPLLEVLG